MTLRNEEYGVDEDPEDKPIDDLYIKRMHTAVLNKAHRKINLDKNVKGDWKKTKKSLTMWIKLLRRIDDHKLQKICGTDIALYVIWLRYSAVFFGVISLINIGIILIYMSGTPKDKDDYKTGNDKSSVL